MGRPGAIITTAKGNAVGGNPARVLFAAQTLREHGTNETIRIIVAKFGIHRATAWKDLTKAKALIALELDAIGTRAAEARRNERIADKAEELAAKAATDGDFIGAATLHRAAVAASREIARLTGAHAPTKLEVTHTGTVEVDVRIDAVLSVLDEADLAALRVISEKIEAAKADGRIAAPAADDEIIEDAELVDDPGPGEN